VSDAERLRTSNPCIVTRVERNRCLLDLRCVPEELDEAVAAAVRGH
jgi:L-seryl-tRNA(Ser) seleniumtransferase